MISLLDLSNFKQRLIFFNSEEPEEWLCRLDAHCHRASFVTRLHRLLHGQGVGIEVSLQSNSGGTSSSPSSSSSELIMAVFGDRSRSDLFASQLTTALLENVSSGRPVQSVDRTEEKAERLAKKLREEAAAAEGPAAASRAVAEGETVRRFCVAYWLAPGKG